MWEKNVFENIGHKTTKGSGPWKRGTNKMSLMIAPSYYLRDFSDCCAGEGNPDRIQRPLWIEEIVHRSWGSHMGPECKAECCTRERTLENCRGTSLRNYLRLEKTNTWKDLKEQNSLKTGNSDCFYQLYWKTS